MENAKFWSILGGSHCNSHISIGFQGIKVLNRANLISNYPFVFYISAHSREYVWNRFVVMFEDRVISDQVLEILIISYNRRKTAEEAHMSHVGKI